MSTKYKKRFCLLLGLILMLFSGCGKLISTPEPITLTFLHHEYNDVGQYQQWAEQFQEQYPNITIELKPSNDRGNDQVTSVDVFIASQFEVLQYVGQRSILNLSSFIEQDEDLNLNDFYPGAMQVFSSEGKRWALPQSIDMMMLYYNKDIFDRYGVAYPQVGWTWADFLDRASDITDPDNDLWAYGLHYTNEFAIYEPVMLIYQRGGRIFDDLQNPTRVTFNEASTIAAMEFYASLIFDHQVAPTWDRGPRLRPSFYPWAGVMQERYAMWTTMFSQRGGLSWPSEWEMSWGVVPLPRDQAEATLASVNGLFISATCEHPEQAWLWIKFLSHQMAPFDMPARRSLAESKEYEIQVGADAAVAARAAIQGAVMVNPDIIGMEKALEAMQGAFEAIRKGDATPAEALDAAQKQSGF